MGLIKRNVSSESKQGRAGTTIVAEGNKFSGEMKVTGKMHIDGTFDGTISSIDNISIGKSGHVRGLIRARHINVSGLLEGDVICDELHIEADGKVQATVTSKQMSINARGNFVGERKNWEQAAVDKALEALPVVEAIEAPAEKVVSKKKG
ncbi:polymer-forming cytoskeletal protein [Pontibacterium sp. N1Y112]|uniref:Polymer-forming cytoskeletal protein n=2 Tax=Pontibacterium sinense TaxID=2781979 RepID=A0A8J7FCF6_9GAMM|nr:polymer-forming cytoskeletal protein [Pontibacterium sinense]